MPTGSGGASFLDLPWDVQGQVLRHLRLEDRVAWSSCDRALRAASRQPAGAEVWWHDREATLDLLCAFQCASLAAWLESIPCLPAWRSLTIMTPPPVPPSVTVTPPVPPPCPDASAEMEAVLAALAVTAPGLRCLDIYTGQVLSLTLGPAWTTHPSLEMLRLCEPADADERAKAVPYHLRGELPPTLRCLDLGGAGGTYDLAALLRHATALTTLRLAGDVKLLPSPLTLRAVLHRLPRLVEYCDQMHASPSVKAYGGMPTGLTRLHIGSGSHDRSLHLGAGGSRFDLGALTNLRHLSLDTVFLDAPPGAMTAALDALAPSLRELVLRDAMWALPHHGGWDFTRLTALTSLDITGCVPDPEDTVPDPAQTALPRGLRHLVLENYHHHIDLSGAPRLEHLAVKRCSSVMTRAIVDRLGAVPNLKSLELTPCFPSPESLDLAPLTALTALTVVDLYRPEALPPGVHLTLVLTVPRW